MKVGELIKILNRFSYDKTVFVEAEDKVISLGDAEEYPDQYNSIIIRTAGVGFVLQSWIMGKRNGRNAYDYNAKRFCCTNCGLETKGETYMRRHLLCKRCCEWLKEEWEG